MKWLCIFILFAFDCAIASDPGLSRCESEQEIAEEIVKAEMSGKRLAGPMSECLNQKHFRHIRSNNFGINTVIDPHPTVIDHRQPIKVRVFKTGSKGEPLELKQHRRVEFSQDVDGRETILGTIFISLRAPSEPLHKTQGCAVAWAFPPKIHIYDNCQDPKK